VTASGGPMAKRFRANRIHSWRECELWSAGSSPMVFVRSACLYGASPMRYSKFLILGSLALAALLSTTSSQADARFYGRGIGFGRGYGGYGYNRGFGYGGYGLGGYRGVGIGLGLGSYGYRGYGLGGYGYGGYGVGGYGLGYGSGYYGSNYYSPSYYGYSYNPGYYVSGYSVSPSYNYAPAYAYSAQPQTYYPNQITPSAASTQQSLYYDPQPTDNTARIHVLVPADAQVWVGGDLTTQTGSDRTFSSPAIQPGKAYTYEVKARWMKEGEPVEQTKQIQVKANETTTVNFSPLAEKQ